MAASSPSRLTGIGWCRRPIKLPLATWALRAGPPGSNVSISLPEPLFDPSDFLPDQDHCAPNADGQRFLVKLRSNLSLTGRRCNSF